MTDPQHKQHTQHSSLATAADIRYLTEASAQFARTDGRMLSLRIGDEYYASVYLHCSFPHTDRSQFISVRTADHQEVGMIRALADFPRETVSLLEEFIHLRYFAPRITKVIHIKEEFGYSYWETETSAGHSRFTVRRGGSHIQSVGENRLMITDVDGNRYMIEDVNALTDKEYRMVEMCM